MKIYNPDVKMTYRVSFRFVWSDTYCPLADFSQFEHAEEYRDMMQERMESRLKPYTTIWKIENR